MVRLITDTRIHSRVSRLTGEPAKLERHADEVGRTSRGYYCILDDMLIAKHKGDIANDQTGCHPSEIRDQVGQRPPLVNQNKETFWENVITG